MDRSGIHSSGLQDSLSSLYEKGNLCWELTTSSLKSVTAIRMQKTQDFLGWNAAPMCHCWSVFVLASHSAQEDSEFDPFQSHDRFYLIHLIYLICEKYNLFIFITWDKTSPCIWADWGLTVESSPAVKALGFLWKTIWTCVSSAPLQRQHPPVMGLC